MVNFSTTTLTSKGQVVIPERTRKRLGMRPGMQFMVMEGKDTVIFKIIQPPLMKDFDKILARTAMAAKREGIKPSDIEDSIKNYRRRKNRS